MFFLCFVISFVHGWHPLSGSMDKVLAYQTKIKSGLFFETRQKEGKCLACLVQETGGITLVPNQKSSKLKF